MKLLYHFGGVTVGTFITLANLYNGILYLKNMRTVSNRDKWILLGYFGSQSIVKGITYSYCYPVLLPFIAVRSAICNPEYSMYNNQLVNKHGIQPSLLPGWYLQTIYQFPLAYLQ